MEEKLKIKTITTKNKDELDKKVNEFSLGNDVRFTQSHVNVVNFSDSFYCVYTVILYFKDNSNVKTNTIENSPLCEVCKENVSQAVKSYSLQHYNKILCRKHQEEVRK